MNKKLAIALTFLYSLLVIGVGISTHSCMGNAQSPEVFSFNNKGCLCDDLMEAEHGCCDDEVELVQIQADQTLSSFNLDLHPSYFVLFSFEFPELIKNEEVTHTHYVQANKPPPKIKVAILYSSLVYYG